MRKKAIIFLTTFFLMLGVGILSWPKINLFFFKNEDSLSDYPKTEEDNWLNDDKKTATKVRLLFGGDLMFDRHIRFKSQQRGSYDPIFSDLKEFFLEYDLVVANLEGPITQNSSLSLGTVPGTPKNFIFTFDLQVAPLLANHNIRLVSLGNNHILNFGREGLLTTREYLTDSGVSFFGFTGDRQNRTITKEINGLVLGFVNYNQFLEGGLVAAKEDIASLAGKVDWLILYSHWGNEYQPRAGAVIEKLAREFIDQGVDLIIGSHPHVVQQKEIYQGKTIYYSLGNFVFDQFFQPEVERGILVELIIDVKTKEAVSKEWPIKMTREGKTIFYSN